MCYVAGLGTISPIRFFIANVLGRLVVGTTLVFIASRSLQMPPVLWIALFLFWVALFGGWYLFAIRRARLSGTAPVSQPEEEREK
jgi:uncharacterized membrane protein YdjX (TVP38/TMEM64 family)